MIVRIIAIAALVLPASLLDAKAHSTAFAPKSEGSGETLFTRLAPEATGLKAVNDYSDPRMWGQLYDEFQGGALATGLAAGDVDGDGWTDLYAVSKHGPNTLYRQVAPLVFEDATAAAGIAGNAEEWSVGATFADVDNDGDLDLYLCLFDAPNQLFLNDGQGRFTEGAAVAGIAVQSGSVVGAFEDYDRDGYLDLFLLTNVQSSTRRPEGEPDHLFRNRGDGTFEEVTKEAGIKSDSGKGHSATWWDANDDGWPDLYIANDFEGPDLLYKNNGDGTFSDITEVALPHTAWYSMGSDFADINNDGLFDFLATDMANTTHFKSKVTMGDMGGWVDYFDTLATPQYMKNAVYLNSGTHRFMEVAKLTGLASTDWTWSPRFADFDNDGWIDLHVTNGMVRSFSDSDMVNKIRTLSSKRQIIALIKNSPILAEKNLAFRNDGAGKLHFTKSTAAWGLQHEGVSFGSVTADFDKDGDLDLVYANYDEALSFYRNDAKGNALIVSLEGSRSNRYGIGARVVAKTSQGTQARRLSIARGALSSSEPIAHFGLGSRESVEELAVHWPSGEVQTLENLSAGQRIRILEPDTGATVQAAKATAKGVKGLFEERAAELGIDFARKEQSFNDMKRQSLLPHRMNTLGGGIAIGDADGDGDSDLYFAGAAGQTGQLYLNQSGSYKADAREQPWSSKVAQEEMNPIWFDANADGLLDLYVSSGGVEAESGAPTLEDALYLNSASGLFSEAHAADHPRSATSSSVVASADFDQDGDLDLFVGGRVIPGDYPRAPASRLLRNDGGTLTDVTELIAPQLQECGMVTAAIWTDASADGKADLLIARELGSPMLLVNAADGFRDDSAQAGLANLEGWWFSLASADVDSDGDIDYILGNIGKNTKYKASEERPFKIYYNDFEGTGTCNIVEAKYEGESLLPVRGRSCSSRAMPSLAEKFPTFHAFGAASLESVYTQEKLSEATLVQAKELNSGILLNDGSGKFSFKKLPREAQLSPVFGIAAADFNADGHLDIALSQNFHGPQVETGRYNGSLGTLLLGNGGGSFTSLSHTESGFFIQGEGRGLAVADLNSDNRPDILATQVDRETLAFINSGTSGGDPLVISLSSSDKGNAAAYGALVTVSYADGSKQAFEKTSTSGHYSQSEPLIFLSRTADRTPVSLEVRWPDGSLATAAIAQSAKRIDIQQSASVARN